MIITIVGGGSTFTPGIVKSIAQRAKELDLDEIRLFDIDKERQDKVAVVVEWILREDIKTDVKLTVTNDEKEAYTDATFIFAQMRVGKYEMREQDEKIPLKYGCVGQETCGCGGMAYGLRTINPMIKVIDDVEKYAKKDHWILNYSNPAAIVSEACRKLRPNARIINICDMPIAIIDMIAESLYIEDVHNIRYDYFGLNHFGWFTSIDYKGRDLLAEIKEYVKEHNINNVKFTGFKSGDELKQIIKESKFVIVPSIWYENLPNTILESFANKKPVIATDIGSLKDTINDGENGYKFKTKDVDSLIEKIKLMDDEDNIRKMGENAYNDAKTIYSIDNHYEELMKIFNKVIKE